MGGAMMLAVAGLLAGLYLQGHVLARAIRRRRMAMPAGCGIAAPGAGAGGGEPAALGIASKGGG